jgi:hypothetical protein
VFQTKVPLPLASEVHRLAALHCQRRNAAYLLSRTATGIDCGRNNAVRGPSAKSPGLKIENLSA